MERQSRMDLEVKVPQKRRSDERRTRIGSLSMTSLVLCKLSMSSIRPRTLSSKSSNPSSETIDRIALSVTCESGRTWWLIYLARHGKVKNGKLKFSTTCWSKKR